jgi:hypothetical protein
MRLTLKPDLRPGIALLLAFLSASPVLALEKAGMPDLCQDEETCLPTSAANVIVWLAKHGYPKLLQSGATEDERDIHTMHAIMGATKARYEFGTRTDLITSGLQTYIHEAGYSADVEYRGIDFGLVKIPAAVKDLLGMKNVEYKTPLPLTPEWLQQNDDPNKVFILLMAYCHFDPEHNVYTYSSHAGHAVTLVNVMPNMILIHDPSHYSDEAGRKILTPHILTSGVLQMPGYDAPLSGLMLLSGSRLACPPDSVVLLTGAVCVTMHPDKLPDNVAATVAGAPGTTVGSDSATGSAPAKATPGSASQSWVMWFFKLLFGK